MRKKIKMTAKQAVELFNEANEIVDELLAKKNIAKDSYIKYYNEIENYYMINVVLDDLVSADDIRDIELCIEEKTMINYSSMDEFTNSIHSNINVECDYFNLKSISVTIRKVADSQSICELGDNINIIDDSYFEHISNEVNKYPHHLTHQQYSFKINHNVKVDSIDIDRLKADIKQELKAEIKADIKLKVNQLF